VHEVREHTLAVDLDDRKLLPIARLELGVAADVHDLELEVDLPAESLYDLERALAEMTAARAVEDDAGSAAYG
jgi:hypothetical protein